MKPDACAKQRCFFLEIQTWLFHVRWSKYEEAWNFGKYPDNPNGRWEQPAKSIVAVNEQCEFPILTGTLFLQRELTHGGQNMNFTASDSCKEMLV